MGAARRLQTTGGIVPRRVGAAPGRARHAGGRADHHVSPRVSRGLPVADRRAGADRRLRDRLPAQDQRDERLCRLHRVVQLLLAPDALAPGPRGVAGVQRAAGAAAHGDRHLPCHREHPRHLRQLRGRVDRRAHGRPRHQQATRLQPEVHRVQARAPLRHQSRGGRRAGHLRGAVEPRVHGRLRPVRADPLAIRRADGGLHRRSADRLGNPRQVLPRAARQWTAGKGHRARVQHLRKRLRARRHRHVPGLLRPHLLAVLHARSPLPRPMQDQQPLQRAARRLHFARSPQARGRDAEYASGTLRRPAAAVESRHRPVVRPHLPAIRRLRARGARNHPHHAVAGVFRTAGGVRRDVVAHRARARKPARGRGRVRAPDLACSWTKSTRTNAPTPRCRRPRKSPRAPTSPRPATSPASATRSARRSIPSTATRSCSSAAPRVPRTMRSASFAAAPSTSPISSTASSTSPRSRTASCA